MSIKSVIARIGSISVLLMAAWIPTQAGAVVLNAMQSQTVAGENFTFNFLAAPMSLGTGVLTIHARGDYDPGTSSEFLTWDIDSLGIGGNAGPTVGGTNIIQFVGINEVEWNQMFSISAIDLATITSDNLVSVTLDLNGNQNTGVGVGFSQNEFVEVTLTYNEVAEPGTLALFGLGLAGLGFARRRKAA